MAQNERLLADKIASASKVEVGSWSRLTPMEIDALVMLARAVTELRRLSHAQRAT